MSAAITQLLEKGHDTMEVSFRVDQRKPLIVPKDGPEMIKDTKCDWIEIIQNGWRQQYPDMIISNPTLKGDKVQFIVEFKNRKANESNVRWRLYNFLRNTPNLKVREIELGH